MSEEERVEAERYPTLTEHGRQMLKFLGEHPHAPIYREVSGNHLRPDDIERVREFDARVQAGGWDWGPGQLPPWLGDFVGRTLADVPYYRRYGAMPEDFLDLPTVSRADLGRDVAQFVPDSIPIDRLINFRTSGTTGHPLLLASHPVVAASYLSFHKKALRRFGIELRHGRGQVGVVLVGFQKKCFTYISVTPTMDESGLAKLNLHPDDWRDPEDRSKYLDALNPEVYTGDPLAFAELLKLPLQTRPRVLLSTSMALLPAMREKLETAFGCPVLDLYSMNEAGPVAVFDPQAGGHVLLQDRLLVEILDPEGRPVTPGERGEITLTGGFNFCLPLLRYRTGDQASLRFVGAEPVLVGLEGRPPVRFRNARGDWLNNIEITHLLRRFSIPQFTVRQRSDGGLEVRVASARAHEGDIRAALQGLFGPGQAMTLESECVFDGKIVQYTSELMQD